MGVQATAEAYCSEESSRLAASPNPAGQPINLFLYEEVLRDQLATSRSRVGFRAYLDRQRRRLEALSMARYAR